ncbi:hypothetical protein SAMN05216276_10922 [Streptosporangium subroseum]|uniref:Uncharacterized protein n=2 Tax=Streptosporangium subroseum TaxID=106412 RepID=A0A239P617_9ACTN|nr:hypothetical protein SAMN05216276_10922 [Streptosporangium subroseum]
MVAQDLQEGFVHLVRLGWDLHGLGVGTSLVLPVGGRPVLEVLGAGETRVRIAVVRRECGWAFIWRPWWARWWRPGEWVWAEADNAADVIASAAIV